MNAKEEWTLTLITSVFRPGGDDVEHRDEAEKKDVETDQEESNQGIQFGDISTLLETRFGDGHLTEIGSEKMCSSYFEIFSVDR